MHSSFCNFPEKCFKLLRSFFRSNLETPSLSHSAPWDPMFIISKLAFFVSHTYSTWNQLSPRSLCFLCRPMQWWLFFFLSWWWHPTISSSVVPFSSHLQSFPASGSFEMSQFFASGGQSIGVSSVLRGNNFLLISFTAQNQKRNGSISSLFLIAAGPCFLLRTPASPFFFFKLREYNHHKESGTAEQLN